MRTLYFPLAAALLWAACATAPDTMPLTYPDTRTEDVTDTYFGTEVADPYRWLEDDRSEETGAWVEAQNAVTRGHLDAIPYRNAIRDRYEQIFNYEKVGAPRKIGDRYYISKNDGLQNQSVWYVRDGLDGEDRVFLDPNTLSEDGTVTASLSSASDDDQYIAVMRNARRQHWQEIRVMDLETGEETGDVLEWVKFSGASWVGDGFYYIATRRPTAASSAPRTPSTACTTTSWAPRRARMSLVFRNDDEPNRYHFAYATEDNRYLILNTSTGTDGNSLHIKDLTDPNADWQMVVDGFNTRSNIVDHMDGKLLMMTDIDAPKYRLVSVDPANPSDRSTWTDVIPESEHLLEGVSTAGGQLFATHLKNACNAVTRYDADGSNPREIALPNATGSTGGFGGKKDATELFYAFTSFTYPTSIFRYDMATGESTPFYIPEFDFDPAGYESKQVFYPSKDGTMVPMFIVHKKGLELDGQRPRCCMPTGFNISLTPASPPPTSSCSSRAASTPCPICAAAASSGRIGTRAACC